MRIIAHELPDGSVRRTGSFEPILAWLMAGRTLEDIRAFIAAQMARGASQQEAERLCVLMQDPEREIRNRGGTDLSRAWAYGLRDGGMTEAAAIDLIARVSCPEAVRHVEVPHDSLHPDYARHRAALKLEGDTLGWDMAKMREEHRKILRQERAPKLAALDIAYQRADEDGDVQAKRAVAARKNALRDITAHPGIEAAQTPAALLAVVLPE